MVIYIALFALAVILGIPLAGRNSSKAKKIIYLSVVFVLMYLVSVFRYGIGNDYLSYIRLFNHVSSTPWSELMTLPYEPLYSVLTKLISTVSTSPEAMYGIYAVIILAPVAYSIYKYSDTVWISVTVYLCLTFFYTSLSFIRQSIAASILLLAYGFIRQRKIIPVLIFAVIATLFHYTALVFIPFYLLAYFLKPTKKTLIIYSSVSVGVLITCLVMKALGANPLNLLANLATTVTGRDYNTYISSTWFESGFGVEYLVMPFAVLALVMISYFLGWREKEGASTQLWFVLFSASLWSFITYAFIVERFSMFLFIFTLFTIPSVLSYYSEKAEKAINEEKAKKAISRKTPGYSSKKSEEKSDNAFLLTIVTVVGMFVYNCWGMYMNFHGVTPYVCIVPAIQDSLDNLDTSEENFEALYTNADLYNYLIQLKNVDYSYAILSTSTDYGGMLNPIRNAADYAGTGLNRSAETEAAAPYYVEYNNRQDEFFSESDAEKVSYTTSGGVVITADSSIASVTDSAGNTAETGNGKIMFVLFDIDGNICDAMEFSVSQPQRTAAKVQLK